MTTAVLTWVSRHRPHIDTRSARLTTESGLLGLAVGIAVVAPWTRDGYLMLLDWVGGPHQAVAQGLYGLDPAALDALPYRLATHGLRVVVGAGATGWLMVLLFFPIAASGVSALAGGGRWRRHPAALFAVCNPFVADRIQVGHVPFLLSVSLVAWVLASAVRARRRGSWFAARPAGWYASAMAIGPHAAWLGGVGLLAVALLPRPRRNDLIRTALIVVAAGCIYAYALTVILNAILTVRVGDADLEVYATRAGPGGMFVTLLSLQGFWREDDLSGPIGSVGAVPAAVGLVVLVSAVVFGLVRLCRHDPDLGAPLAALAVCGIVLGAGTQGPFGVAYRWAFDAVPLFEAMREQQKWVALAMLAYAVGVGAAAEALADAVPRRYFGKRAYRLRRLGAALALVALGGVNAIVATTLVWGLGGAVRVTDYPESWYAADRIMGDGSGLVLFLPWHQYQPFSFTGGRTVGTPAAAFFRRPVLTSDAVELGEVRTNSVSRRTAYMSRLIAAGGTGHFGRMVAPLGVEWVVLARDREATTYDWLAKQPDLRRVLRSRQLDLYRVLVQGTGRVVASRQGGFDDAVRLADTGQLGSEAMLPEGPAQGKVPSARYGGIDRIGPTRWRVEPGPPGWVVIPEEWSAGWTSGADPPRQTVAGTVAVRAGPDAVTVDYEPWRWLRVGLLVSMVSLGLLIVAGLAEHRRDLTDWWVGTPS
ncbi:hypothetical protein EV385_6327 [Krasilnikovia cinnamomea]|uniref:Membrane protein YfhO n=1 Tax=Krasilnikovia cinnamomea TaxID=349313 RepID=A0A4V2G7Y8_9ACTN|nr:hypothetical protein [Krasilnikovia cinnamomea]RZU54376.1 hypothetical protein EV385_6327 [Krasilnikovia cinnamomea]